MIIVTNKMTPTSEKNWQLKELKVIEEWDFD